MTNKTIILFCMIMFGLLNFLKSQPKPFVPTDFKVPAILETVHFRARMLTVNDLVKDYNAVMTIMDHL